MKILVIGDLHGRKPKIHFKDFNCIIQVGDVCDDSEFRPYINKMFAEWKKGNYDFDYKDLIIKEKGKLGLKAMEKKSLEKGREILKYLNSFGKPVFFVPGNWDQSYGDTRIKDSSKNDYSYFKSFYDFYLSKNSNPKLIKGLKNVYDCQHRLYNFLDFNIIGHGLTSVPESISKRLKKFSFTKSQRLKITTVERKLFNVLENLFKERDKKLFTIFLSHNVVSGTKLDKIFDKKKNRYGNHFGSDFGERLIKKYKTELAIGGHMHEHFGKARLGKTIVINAGFGRNKNILLDVDLKKRKVKKIEFYGGKLK